MMTQQNISYKINVYVLAVLLLFGCSENQESVPPPQQSPEEFIVEGWSRFQDRLYVDALNNFNAALSISPQNSSASVGKAWTLLILDNEETSALYGQIESFLENNIGDSIWAEISFCGLAIVHFVQENYSSAIIYSDSLLARDSLFVFDYNNDIDYRDIILVKAQAQFFIQQYMESANSLIEVSPSYDLDNYFDINSQEFWLIDGVEYENFVYALVAMISKVSNEVDIDGFI